MKAPKLPNVSDIPSELAESPSWCAWSSVPKTFKAPLGRDGKPADVQNSNPGMTLTEALTVAKKVGGGVGLCLFGTQWAAIDGDGAYMPDGGIKDWALPVLAAADSLYIETSPSGFGFHAIGHAPKGAKLGRTNTRRPGSKKEGLETFIGRGYLTVTGASDLGPPPKLGSVAKAITAAMKVAKSWGRRQAPEPGDAALVVVPREGATIDPKLLGAIMNDPRFKATWEGLRPDLESASEYDMSLASAAAGIGADQQQAWDVVVAARVNRGEDVAKVLRQDYAESTLLRAFGDVGKAGKVAPHGIALDELYAHIPSGRFIWVPSRELWGAQSINQLIPSRCIPGGLKAATWLIRNQHVEQMTWQPGWPQIIEDRIMTEDGWISHYGASVFNLYLPPRIPTGNAEGAGRWLELLEKLYPEEANELLDWMAHRVQQPEQKVNHAIVLGGAQGIGKDTLLHPLKHAVGTWNFTEVSPKQLLGRFNGFVKSVVLRVSEARDLGEVGRFDFYDHTKILIAAPPDTIRVDEKNLREYSVPNLCGVCITTNHRDGLYLPVEDRRHFVGWSKAHRDDFDADYWQKLWQWYEAEGLNDIATFLATRDISKFDPKAPPRQTPAFKAMVGTGLTPEDSEMVDALEALGWPDAVTFDHVATVASGELGLWLGDSRKSWKVRKRMESAGYEAVANPDTTDGRFKVGGKKFTVFCKARVAWVKQIAAIEAMCDDIAKTAKAAKAGK